MTTATNASGTSLRLIKILLWIGSCSISLNRFWIVRHWLSTLLALRRRIVSVEPKLKVGQNIRANRERLGITQEALAHRAGMHPVEVGRAERGIRDLRVSTVVKIARGLGVPPGDLLAGA
ncbi:MAG: helix-turn-helix domain-containing protein [Solirubrobacteraceae bacterium]